MEKINPKRKDITGQKFGKLTAVKPLYSNKKYAIVWECICDCGKTMQAPIGALTSGNTKSCGCSKKEAVQKRLKDITGNRYNKLVVLEYSHTKRQARYWKCQCDCGNITLATSNWLSTGHKKSCGCANREPTSQTHGLSKQTPLYFVWKDLRHRCSNKNHKSYKIYGARGITVCKEWEDFEVFYKWAIENGYKEEKLSNGKNKWTIDRIDVNGNYEPSNCRFVTNEVQANNKRNTLRFDYNGKRYNLTELANDFNIDRMLLYDRLHTKKWDLEKALTTPKRDWSNRYGRENIGEIHN